MVAMRLPINIAGGSISLTMLPIAVLALRRGALAGAVGGTVFGLLDLLMEPFILFPAQVALDYPVPYLLFGTGVGLFSGIYNRAFTKTFSNKTTAGFKPPATAAAVTADANEAATGTAPGGFAQNVGSDTSGNLGKGSLVIVAALLTGGILRYLIHVISGVLFFAEYAGGENVWAYSLIYNLSYLGPSLLASLIGTLIILPVLSQALPVHGKVRAQSQA
jgi:thiamine transporter